MNFASYRKQFFERPEGEIAINLFGFLENRKLGYWLDIGLNVVVAVAIFLVINRGASIIVAEISRAQL